MGIKSHVDIFPAEKPSGASSAPHKEQRQSRRVGVSRQLRIRPAEFNHGSFEEVRTTQNASSRGFYFLTTTDRYFEGMRLRIIPADGSFADSAAWQDTGEVVRVERFGDNYGVAVHLSTPGHSDVIARPIQSRREGNQGRAERRRADRSQFIATTELVDESTGSRTVARISDLGLRGCYIDTLNPQLIGTTLRLVIQKDSEIFDVLARVRSRHVGSGMGLEFDGITAGQCALLEKWLSGPLTFSQPGFTSTILSTDKTGQFSEVQQSLALRLLQTLVRKGVLSQSEASALLSESES